MIAFSERDRQRAMEYRERIAAFGPPDLTATNAYRLVYARTTCEGTLAILLGLAALEQHQRHFDELTETEQMVLYLKYS